MTDTPGGSPASARPLRDELAKAFAKWANNDGEPGSIAYSLADCALEALSRAGHRSEGPREPIGFVRDDGSEFLPGEGGDTIEVSPAGTWPVKKPPSPTVAAALGDAGLERARQTYNLLKDHEIHPTIDPDWKRTAFVHAADYLGLHAAIQSLISRKVEEARREGYREGVQDERSGRCHGSMDW